MPRTWYMRPSKRFWKPIFPKSSVTASGCICSVYNLCKDFYLSNENIRPLSDADDEIPDTFKEDELDMEEIERLNNMLEKLPEREAEVVRMNVMDELSFVEISQILSTPASTVKSRFKSGMDKLRKQYLKNQ